MRTVRVLMNDGNELEGVVQRTRTDESSSVGKVTTYQVVDNNGLIFEVEVQDVE